MKKLFYRLFCALFTVICLIPSLGMLVVGETQPSANEILSSRPQLTDPLSGSFNWSVLQDTSDYFTDRFAFRKNLVTAQASVFSTLFHVSIADEVTVGKDGWLFYTETMDDCFGENLMTDREIFAAKQNLALMQEYTQSQNVQFLFVCVPNKGTIYAEYLPDGYKVITAENNRVRLFSKLDRDGVQALDLASAFLNNDEVVYYQMDSHWTDKGAALAHDQISKSLVYTGKKWCEVNFIETLSHKGDLYEMLYPTGSQLETAYLPEEVFTFSHLEENALPDSITIHTTSENGKGSLLMFRDSFGNSLYPYMAEDAAQAEFSRSNPYKLYQLETGDYDSLVIEIVERNLSWLAQRAPLMPAPQRDIDPSGAEEIDLAVLVTNQAAEWEGYQKLTGSIPQNESALDANSPVYISAGGILYEASPVDTGFTMYLPIDISIPEELIIYFYSEGQLSCTLAHNEGSIYYE